MGLLSSKCKSATRLDGKTAIVTGSSTGIGKETAKDFFLRGAKVIMACRNIEKANAAAEDIRKQCSGESKLGQLLVAKLDLMSLKSVKICANFILQNEEKIDILINNAGIMSCPKTYTEDGYESQFATNHLGHFFLTMLLLPKICQSAPARIVNVSSMAHYSGTIDFTDLNYKTTRTYTPIGAYQQSKLANILFTRELARRLANAGVKGVNVYSLHPGLIATELGRNLDEGLMPGVVWLWKNIFKYIAKTPAQGAQTTIYCAVDDKYCLNETGLYYRECGVSHLYSKKAADPELARRLWEESIKMVGLEQDYNSSYVSP